MKIGIDTISFYTSRYYIDLKTLSKARGFNESKFYNDTGQRKMATLPPNEDIITLATNAAKKTLSNVPDQENIKCLFFATESSFDQAKSAGIYVHHFLNLKSDCRVIELKQACYSATAALQMAVAIIKSNPKHKVLILASDVARYGLQSIGETTQGCGAIAMVISTNPRLIEIETHNGVYSEHVMDFWRPYYLEEALVSNKYSVKKYLEVLQKAWRLYEKNSNYSFKDINYHCYHTPSAKMAEKVYIRFNNFLGKKINPEEAELQMKDALTYGKEIGNSYTASLYISLISLLENKLEDLTNKRIGFFSYGSGCVAEYFGGIVQLGYNNHLLKEHHQKILKSRTEIDEKQYEYFYNFSLPKDGTSFTLPNFNSGPLFLEKFNNHKREYKWKETL